MSMIFKFRMLSDEDDNFVREYEVPYDMNLLEFHNFICKDLKYDNNNMTSFFASDSNWNKLREFTLTDMGLDEAYEDDELPLPMEKVLLSQIIHKNNDRLIYQFDIFGDRAMYLELIETKKMGKGEKYPAVTARNGSIPNQFEAGTRTGTCSIFDEAMSEFEDFTGDDNYDDEY